MKLSILGLLVIGLNLCSWGQNKIDVSIENIKIKPSSPKIGDEVTISFDIKNNGTSIIPSEAYVSTLLIDGKIVSFDDESPKLLPQQQATYSKSPNSYHILINSTKKYKWEIRVKLKNLKDENTKNNNYKGFFVVSQ